jgi:hypothetical protein
MLASCNYCKFYIREDDEFCLNCGMSTREDDKPESQIRFLIIISLVCAALAYLTADVFGKNWLPGAPFWISFLYVFCFLLILTVPAYVDFGLFYNKKISRKLVSNLTEKQKIIEKRVAELSLRGRKIDAVLDKIKETDSPQLQRVRARLLSAREVVISQFARYELQKQKIELVRLQNDVSPYLSQLHRLDESDLENGLGAIEQTSREINMIRQNLTRYDAIEFPPRAVPEKENFLAQLAETESSCEKLREALLAKQAISALQGIQPLEESLNLPPTKDLAHAAETFNIQTTLTDFSESFDELEREYKRLKAEDEVSRKLMDE